MALDLDMPPVNDQVIKGKTNLLSDVWTGWFSTFWQTLALYVTSNGIFLPQLTTAQRNAITTPINGQMIYNTTAGSGQYYKAGVWTNF